MNLFRSIASLLTDKGWLCFEAENGAVTRCYFSDAELHEGEPDPVLISALIEMQEYLQGERKSFTVPLNPAGTNFQKNVWKELTTVQHCKTLSYKHFTASFSNDKSTRAVATAIAANPVAILIPCHRIVGSNGALTGYAWGIQRKEWLLQLEQGAYMPSLFEDQNEQSHG